MNSSNKENSFSTFYFDRENELALFSQHNQILLESLPALNKLIDEIIKDGCNGKKLDLLIYSLGRVCIKNFHSILLLSSSGQGCDAQKVLRCMFERIVDAKYISKNPNEINDFFDFYQVQLKIRNSPKFDSKYEPLIDRFREGKRYRLSWSKKSLKKRAESVGFTNTQIQTLYTNPNSFVHSSVSEISYYFFEESERSLVSPTFITDSERNLANSTFEKSYFIILCVLDLLINYFDKPETKPQLDNLRNNYCKFLEAKGK